MDPNETLRVARAAADRLLNDYDPEVAYSLAENFTALDIWLSRGGFPPADWQPTPPAVDTMPCGCESGSCYCDTIARDWDAHDARNDARDCDGYPLTPEP